MKELIDVVALREEIKERMAAEQGIVARNLRAIRKQRALSQNEVAELCDMSERHYGEIERGEANFTLETRVKLCVGLKVTPYELFGDIVVGSLDASV